ncbi:MAG: response regulator [Chthoniobacteraceae bacterium]
MPITNRPIKVLLIEDNKEHAELLGRLLGFAEYPKFTVITATTLAAGLGMLERGAPDIVLLDLSLPDSGGVETFRRTNAAAPTLPIVILSGVADVTVAIEMVQAGAQDYLVKGHVDMHLLLRSIQYAIERKHGQVLAQKVNAELEARVNERTAAMAAVNEQLKREIGERRQAEEQLAKTNRHLTVALAELRGVQRSRATAERTGSATREIEDAFKRIHQHAELILHAPALLANPEKLEEHLQQIAAAADAGRKALRKPGDGQASAASETDPLPSSAFETVSLDSLIDGVIALSSPITVEQADGAAPKVTFERKADKAAEILGDPIQLREMLAHLVRNSMNAIPRRGKITIGVQRQGWESVLFVQDDGLGVTEATRKRLLDPSAAVDRADGWPSGYGVIHEVVARHGSRLEIESRKGLGTTVRVIFPPAKPAGAGARRRRVLVVDDDPIVREVISAYLAEDGYTVALAVNGREGLEKFSAEEFDIVLTDRSMPEMEGDELAREVKKQRPDVPVILITGFGDIMAATGEKPEGVDIVMSKPFTMAGLQNTLAKFR